MPYDYLTKFEMEWEKVSGIAYRVSKMDELEAVLQKVLVLAETHGVTISRNPLLTELHIADRLNALDMIVTSWADDSKGAGNLSLADFEKASFHAGAGITGVDYVLAETGTLVLSSATEGVQVASLAPPMHVALFRRSQLVGSLDELLAKLQPLYLSGEASTGRSVVFVTGTSRTADIEQILIHGVHGPGQAHAILVEDSCW
jgi:L-lactate utilization protein LutC